MLHNIKYFIILSSLFFLNCEKYINSQTESNLNDREITVTGTVVNKFTSQAIKGALVNFGGRDTLTDHLGKFELRYRLTVDNDRNKPVELIVSANNYFDYKRAPIVAPIDYTFAVRMIYAAPIINNSILVHHYFTVQKESLVVVQALVFDYQGADEIDSVGTTLYYRNQVDQTFRTSIIPMRLIEKLSQNAAHYQAVVIPRYLEDWYIQNNFDVYVEDSLGYSTFIQDSPINPLTGDTLIFPPIYYQPKRDSIFTN